MICRAGFERVVEPGIAAPTEVRLAAAL